MKKETTANYNEVRCPYCDREQRDSWELGDGAAEKGETECQFCEEIFFWEREITAIYTGRLLGDMDDYLSQNNK